MAEAFIKEGDGTFDVKRIFAADAPVNGANGIELADIDDDGNLDALHERRSV